MTDLKKPDFLVVGAEKCGTTWLADMLRQHPQVFIPPEKEIHYFNRRFSDFPKVRNLNFDKPLAWYLAFFSGAEGRQRVGEACPAYLWDESAPARIHAFDPSLSILALLRNPIERTFSAYRFWMQRGVVGRISFRRAVEQYPLLLLERSRYASQLKRYLDLYPRDNVRVWVMDLPGSSMTNILEQVEDFLSVPRFVPANAEARSNVTAEPRSWFLNWLTARIRLVIRGSRIFLPLVDGMRKVRVAQALEGWRIENKSKAAPTTVLMMSPEDRSWIGSLLQDDIHRLEDQIGMELGHWR